MVITIFLCTPLRIRYLQAKILCSCKGEGFFEGGVFPITTPAAPVVSRKDTVSEVVDEEDTQDTDYDTEDLADLPTDSDSDDAPDNSVGLDPGSDGDSQ